MEHRIIASAIATLISTSAYADDLIMQRVAIEGNRGSQLGLLDAANAGSIDQKKLVAMTSYRPGELLEAIPGVIVSQHSGEGKANQFFLRGFNLDHGTDLRTTLDDMPLNQRSHAHGQGWTDLNFLIPELAARIDYKKGPYSASNGDFAAAGSAAILYANRLSRNILSTSLGQLGYARALIASSPDFASGSLLYAIETAKSDGPFVTPDRHKKFNAVLRYSEGFANNGFTVSAMHYRAHWNASDQIPVRAVLRGELSRALQQTADAKAPVVSLSKALWAELGLADGAQVRVSQHHCAIGRRGDDTSTVARHRGAASCASPCDRCRAAPPRSGRSSRTVPR